MRKTKAEKIIDSQIEAAYYRHGSGVRINIMDIPKVFTDARAKLAEGANLDAAMPEIVARYRQN